MEEIISQCDICYVGLADTDGTPYVIPMNFGYQDGVIYLHSGYEGRSKEILERNNRVCVTFSAGHRLTYQHPDVACSYSMKARSVIASGKVEFEESKEAKVDALNILMKHYSGRKFSYSDPAVNNVKVWKIVVDRMTGKEFGISNR